MHQLKWCQVTNEVLTGALWVPLGDLAKAMRPDRAVVGRPHGFAMPTIYKWGTIRRGDQSGQRMGHTEATEAHVVGGIHLTNPPFLPAFIIKEMTATEDDYFGGSINLEYLINMDRNMIDVEEGRLQTLYYKKIWIDSLGKHHLTEV